MDLYFVLGLFALVGLSGLGFLVGWFGHIAVANSRPKSSGLVPWLLAVLGFGCAGVVGRTDPISFGLGAFLAFGVYLTLCLEAGMVYARRKEPERRRRPPGREHPDRVSGTPGRRMRGCSRSWSILWWFNAQMSNFVRLSRGG